MMSEYFLVFLGVQMPEANVDEVNRDISIESYLNLSLSVEILELIVPLYDDSSSRC